MKNAERDDLTWEELSADELSDGVAYTLGDHIDDLVTNIGNIYFTQFINTCATMLFGESSKLKNCPRRFYKLETVMLSVLITFSNIYNYFRI
jgi:hypothetical protein